jgi:hypothetical protein
MIESESDRLQMLADWGASLTLPTDETIPAIVDRDFILATLGDMGVESSDPQALVSTAQIADVLSERDTITIADSNVTGVDGAYSIREIQPDGTGLTLLKLKTA